MATRRAYLGLGSNLGDRPAYLQAAVDELAAQPSIAIVGISPVYETEPIGPEQPDYLNAVVAVDTDLSAHALLDVARAIETGAKRQRAELWGPRTLDIDVLVVGDERIDDDDLQIPHPRMYERGFVCVPLHDLAPDLVPAPLDGEWDGVVRTEVELTVPVD
jgi:2-amino-4-hydroxy-6-hydroxymethyldihydropteridine diphosphokinase